MGRYTIELSGRVEQQIADCAARSRLDTETYLERLIAGLFGPDALLGYGGPNERLAAKPPNARGPTGDD